MKKSDLINLIKECHHEMLLERNNPLTNSEIKDTLENIFTVYDVGYKIDNDIVTLYSPEARIVLKIISATK